MHTNILTKNQFDLIPIVTGFGKKGYYLVGGTALALQLGHRRSLDYDLFTKNSFDNKRIVISLRHKFATPKLHINSRDELILVVHETKMTWYNFPYDITCNISWPGVIQMPDVLTIAAMKAFALGQRAKWKDYVDLYFVMKKYSLKDIVEKARELFGSEVNDRIFREQLSYFDDINYNEQPDYLPGFEVPNEEIKRVLADVACTE
ncbi:MAG: nucleotidyl transferase AbiEii/AbiGii toxin family protein [Patescibacteria group bacterium]